MVKRRSLSEEIRSFPDSPGVYLFFGANDILLYVGKSITLRTRIRSHFSSRDERWLCRKVRRIEVQPTAGELGALLLESKLIKELRPMYNVAARRGRRIVVARRFTSQAGYLGVNLESIDSLRIEDAPKLLGVFKHMLQAKDYLAGIARTHRLCYKLLGLEQSRSYCFSYHLGRCGGACMGEEDPAPYNRRLEAAFDERRIKAWPFAGRVVVEELSHDTRHSESFLIDNWCLLSSIIRSPDGIRKDDLRVHRFDYDSYKILYSYLTDPAHQKFFRIVSEE